VLSGSTTTSPRHPYTGAMQGRHVANAVRGVRTTLWSATQRRRRLKSISRFSFRNYKTPKVSTNLKISKNKSYRGAIDLQLSQRATYVLINGLSGNVGRSWQNSRPQVTVHSAFNSIFGQFALKIGMSANYEKCVPGNN
jgi:hypothetical protein